MHSFLSCHRFVGGDMDKTIYIEVSEQPLDIQNACDIVSDPAHGAIDVFIGAVRNHHQGNNVIGITYDVHKDLAERTLHKICEEAQGMWPETKYYVAHYKGTLDIGGISVLIAVSSAHRSETFEACRYVIEEIKKRAPVWKQEHYPDRKSTWLPGHSLTMDTEIGETCCGKCNV